jgi:hypothetical protein
MILKESSCGCRGDSHFLSDLPRGPAVLIELSEPVPIDDPPRGDRRCGLACGPSPGQPWCARRAWCASAAQSRVQRPGDMASNSRRDAAANIARNCSRSLCLPVARSTYSATMFQLFRRRQNSRSRHGTCKITEYVASLTLLMDSFFWAHARW